MACDDLNSDLHVLPKMCSTGEVVFSSCYIIVLNNYFFSVESLVFLKFSFVFGLSCWMLCCISSAWGTWKANDTITAIGTAKRTQKNHIIVPHSKIHMNTTNGLTHNVFHINTGTKNFSSDCCIIVYSIITAKTHHRPANIKAETAAGIAPKNGPRYGMISNNHASTANVAFWGILIQNISNIRSHAYDAIHINRHKKSWLFNHLVIPEYAASILDQDEDIWRNTYFNMYLIS